MKDNWKIYPKCCDDILEQLLSNRGVKISQKETFLDPSFERDLLPSDNLPDFQIFIKRLRQSIDNKEKVAIYADYDADGIPGAAFLYKTLEIFDLDVEVYIPTRDEGYGLSKKGIDLLVKRRCNLIITVDLGIKNIEEVEYARDKGVDIIITDHHLPGDKLPKAVAVVNPKIKNSKYPFKDLSGAGVIFKLICGLSKYYEQINESFIKWNLDLIAISTISDVVNLSGENRMIAKFGLKVLNKTNNIGIKQIIKRAELNNKQIGSHEVGFIIGPRINAPGRISKPRDSYELLTTTSPERAIELAEKLEVENSERQEMSKRLFLEAEKIIQKDRLHSNNIIVLRGTWHKGILGPCASKIAEKFSRPVILLTTDKKNKLLVGSARSVNNIDIMKILEGVSKYIRKYGGHSGAAGISLDAVSYEEFIQNITDLSNRIIDKADLVTFHEVDVEIDFNEITLSLMEQISRLEPFGQGNKKPLFLTRLSKMHNPKFVGKELNHLSSYLCQSNQKIKSVYFNCPLGAEKINHLSEVDIIYNLEEQSWNGKKYIQIKIVDLDLIMSNNDE